MAHDGWDRKPATTGAGITVDKVVLRECPNYTPNNSPYPLCIGNGSESCSQCCWYEDMDEPPFDK